MLVGPGGRAEWPGLFLFRDERLVTFLTAFPAESLPILSRKSLYNSAPYGVYGDETVKFGITPSWCERLYAAKAASLILYGRALGLSHGEAEDVLHETFLALLRRESPPEDPEHYCVRSFRNHAFNHRRSLWRRLTRELESQRWFERSPGETEAERLAMRALAELPLPQREVIVLKIWHRYTFEEIGETLGISPNTAAGRYRYGIEKIRAAMKGKVYERDERIGDAVAFLETAPPIAGA